MNRKLNLWFMAALVGGLCLSIGACKDDDNVEKTDSRIVTEGGKTGVPEEQLTDEENRLLDTYFAFVSTIKTLAGVEKITPETMSTTHEPIYGVSLDDESSTVRVVKCDTIIDAELRFREIAGLDSAAASHLLTPTSDGYVLDLRNLPIHQDGKTLSLGTLTFHREGGPSRYGYVDVAIPCIPHLERIDYLSPAAFPDNDGVNSPYMVGDIVWVPGGGSYCGGYYLCIKAFDGITSGYMVHLSEQTKSGGNGGDETVNLDDDDEGCFNPYNATKDKKNATTAEHIRAYLRFIRNNQGMVTNIKNFFQEKAYNKKPTYPGKMGHIFPSGFAEGPYIHKSSKTAMIWYNSSWTGEAILKADFILFEFDIPVGELRKAESVYVSSQCYNPDGGGVDTWWLKYWYDSSWRDYWNKYDNFCMNVITFGSNQIGSLDFSPLTEQLTYGIYPEDATTENLGWLLGSDGILYKDINTCKYAKAECIGTLAYISDGSFFGSMVTEEKNGGGRGLVLSEWSNSKSKMNPDREEMFIEANGFVHFVGNTMESALYDFGGQERTRRLSTSTLNMPVIERVKQMRHNISATPWFLPTMAQWMAIFGPRGLGGASMPSPTTSVAQALTISYFLNGNESHWSLSASDPYTAQSFTTSDAGSMIAARWNPSPKWSDEAYVRAVLAFGPAVPHNNQYEDDSAAYEDYMESHIQHTQGGLDATLATKDNLGWCYGKDNRIYKTADKAIEAGTTPLGILAFVNDGSAFGERATEKDNGYGHGLVVGYTGVNNVPLNSGGMFTPGNGFGNYIGDTWEAALNDFDGYERTQALAKADRNVKKKITDLYPFPPSNTSGWFVPTIGQWVAILCKPGIGGINKPDPDDYFWTTLMFSDEAFDKLRESLSSYNGSKPIPTKGYIWTTSATAPTGNIVIDISRNLRPYKSTIDANAVVVFAY